MTLTNRRKKKRKEKVYSQEGQKTGNDEMRL